MPFLVLLRLPKRALAEHRMVDDQQGRTDKATNML